MFSVLCDETTNIAVLKDLNVYVRYLDKDCDVQTSFLAVQDTPNGKAETITQTLIKILLDCGLDCKLCGFGSDGANVMTDRKAGVVTKIRAQFPVVISNHCVSHRLALASADAANAIGYANTFSTILNTFYQNSALLMAGFKEIESNVVDSIIDDRQTEEKMDQHKHDSTQSDNEMIKHSTAMSSSSQMDAASTDCSNVVFCREKA
ncbi:UNVERIFIED_CONTAM: hypothetical protein FKN15_028951 [Acipenser sinensis]